MAQNYGYGGGRANPYDQRDESPGPPYPTGGGYEAYGAPQQSYGRQNQYNAPAMGRDEFAAGQNVEMEPLAPNGQQFGRQGQANSVLDEIKQIDGAILSIYDPDPQNHNNDRGLLADIRYYQAQSLKDSNPNSQFVKKLDEKNTDTMNLYRNLVDRVRRLKSRPDAGSSVNRTQISRIDRKVKDIIRMFQKQDADYREKIKEQTTRQILIVNPDASPQELEQALENPQGQQVFAQALMQGNRRGQAQSTLSAVQSRHQDIQRIAEQMNELAQLFNDMDVLVVQQEAAVTNIEMKGEEVVENMDKGTEQIGVAVKSARNARKWKWWCLGISVLIIVIIVIIVLLYQFVFGPNAKSNRDATQNKKRFVLPSSLTTESFISTKPFDADSKLEVPGLDWTHSNELVRKTKLFQA